MGAGTVTTPERCRIAMDSGAEFVLTPSVNRDTIEFCLKHAIRILPGVMTPTDVDVCLSYGLNIMKLFPAGDLPENYIKSLKGPFDGTEYVAVGGVNAGNIGTFLKEGSLVWEWDRIWCPENMWKRNNGRKPLHMSGVLFRA